MASVGGIRTCKSELLHHLTSESKYQLRRTQGVPRRWLYPFEPRFLTRLMCETLRISPEECGCARSNKVKKEKGRQASSATLRRYLPTQGAYDYLSATKTPAHWISSFLLYLQTPHLFISS